MKMKYSGILLACMVVAALMMIGIESARADAGSCYAISSPDHRAYCLAKARGEPSMCYAIQSTDLRAQCLAEVRKN